jgi:hypothetical protein
MNSDVFKHSEMYFMNSDFFKYTGMYAGKWAVVYMFVKGIEFAPFYNFLIGFGTVPTVW